MFQETPSFISKSSAYCTWCGSRVNGTTWSWSHCSRRGCYCSRVRGWASDSHSHFIVIHACLESTELEFLEDNQSQRLERDARDSFHYYYDTSPIRNQTNTNAQLEEFLFFFLHTNFTQTQRTNKKTFLTTVLRLPCLLVVVVVRLYLLLLQWQHGAPSWHTGLRWWHSLCSSWSWRSSMVTMTTTTTTIMNVNCTWHHSLLFQVPSMDCIPR